MRQPHSIPRFLFHFTSPLNALAIKLHGFKIKKDRRGKGRVWFASADGYRWARWHVRKTHQWENSEVHVLKIDTTGLSLSRRRKGIYYSKLDVPASSIC